MNTAKANFKRAYGIVRALNRASTTLGNYDPIAVYLVGYDTEDGWVHSYECDPRDNPEYFGKLRSGLHFSYFYTYDTGNQLDGFTRRVKNAAMLAFANRLWCQERPPVPAIESKAARDLEFELNPYDDDFVQD